ncbi:MAG: P22 coat - protein 5 family protein [Nitrosomonas sp.]|nr:P22 coat - protein 5 family protein [Nitrosomonas sp.]
MPNTLNNLAADIYTAADVVGRELVGVVSSATINTAAGQAVAKGDTVRSHFTRTPTVNSSYAPSMTVPEGTNQTVDNKTLAVNQFASVQIPWEGEEIKHVGNGSGFETIYGDQIAQAMRSIANTIESYVAGIVKAGSSRAFGTAGTTPFGSNFNEVAELHQILVDNGCPMDGQVSMVINTLAGTKLRNLAQLQKVSEAGGDQLLRQGELLNLQGISLKESAGIGIHTKGTGTGYLVNSAAITAGTTTIPTDTGTGTLIAGDVVTFAADTVNKYVVGTTLSGGNFALGAPGTRVAIADNNAITIGNNYTANVAFHRSAVEVVVRAPALPANEAAQDVMTVTDPWSGLTFQIASYGGYMKSMIEVRCLYDAVVWKPNHVATLLG